MKQYVPALLVIYLTACQLPGFPDANAKKNVSYGSHERNKLDIYFPSTHDTSTAVVVLIHGGAWVAGDKTNWSSEQISQLKQRGYAVSAINYRYADGDFHHQMNDIKMAITYIQSHAADWKISGNKFALIGGSAGGHLALLYGHGFDTAHVVKASISLCGPTNMSDTLFQHYANNYQLGYVFEQFLGATVSANPQVYKSASPVSYHSQVPTLLIHGLLDDLVPPSQSQEMFDTLQAHSIPTDTTFFGNANHDVSAGGVNNSQIFSEINNWLSLYLN